MKQINKRYYVCGNDFKEKVVPSTKQTEEISANNKIKCDYVKLSESSNSFAFKCEISQY